MVSLNSLFPKVALKRIYALSDSFATTRNAWPLITVIKALFHRTNIESVHQLYKTSAGKMAEPVGVYHNNWRGKPQIFINPTKIPLSIGYAIALLHEFAHHLSYLFISECSLCPDRMYCPRYRATPLTLAKLVEVAIDTLL